MRWIGYGSSIRVLCLGKPLTIQDGKRIQRGACGKMEITNIPSFLQYYENIRQRTMNVVRSIPPEKFDWSYSPGKFTCADLVRHIAAIERYMFAECVQFRTSCYPGHGKELADGYE